MSFSDDDDDSDDGGAFVRGRKNVTTIAAVHRPKAGMQRERKTEMEDEEERVRNFPRRLVKAGKTRTVRVWHSKICST